MVSHNVGGLLSRELDRLVGGSLRIQDEVLFDLRLNVFIEVALYPPALLGPHFYSGPSDPHFLRDLFVGYAGSRHPVGVLKLANRNEGCASGAFIGENGRRPRGFEPFLARHDI